MKVILRKDIESLGKMGDVVLVSDGYAMNYLVPNGHAYAALKENEKLLVQEKKQYEKKIKKEVEAAQAVAVELGKISVTIPVQVGEEDRIFGTVTAQMIADNLAEKGFEIDRKKIMLEEHISKLGIYSIDVKLHQNVTAKVSVWVVKE